MRNTYFIGDIQLGTSGMGDYANKKGVFLIGRNKRNVFCLCAIMEGDSIEHSLESIEEWFQNELLVNNQSWHCVRRESLRAGQEYFGRIKGTMFVCYNRCVIGLSTYSEHIAIFSSKGIVKPKLKHKNGCYVFDSKLLFGDSVVICDLVKYKREVSYIYETMMQLFRMRRRGIRLSMIECFHVFGEMYDTIGVVQCISS